MIVRKLFNWEAAHIVRDCYTDRCSKSIHGHSYKAELVIKADKLDIAGMVIDFGLLKNEVFDLFDSFDHATILWEEDHPELIECMKKFSERLILLPHNPTAEAMAAFFAQSCQILLQDYVPRYQEGKLEVVKVLVHETATGYAEATLEDSFSQKVFFSDAIKSTWKSSKLLDLGIAK